MREHNACAEGAFDNRRINMAKDNKKKQLKEISMTPLLWFGFILIVATALVNSFFPNFPKAVSTVAYVFGLFALIIYMWQKAFEKRTGYEELPEKKKSGKKK